MVSYSSRFTVTGLTGTTPPLALAAVPGGTAGPADQNNVSPVAGQADNPAAAVGAAGDYDTPYNKQGGTIRYAPMQPFPPTKITKQGKPTPQYPTSAYNIATARMPAPSVVTTLTESQTVKAMTMENTVCLFGDAREVQSVFDCAPCCFLLGEVAFIRFVLIRVPGRTPSASERRHGQISCKMEGLSLFGRDEREIMYDARTFADGEPGADAYYKHLLRRTEGSQGVVQRMEDLEFQDRDPSIVGAAETAHCAGGQRGCMAFLLAFLYRACMYISATRL